MLAYVVGACFSFRIEKMVQCPIQWNLFLKDTLNKGHLSNEDTVRSINHIELYTNLPLKKGHLCIQDSQLGPNSVHYGEAPLCNVVEWCIVLCI